MSMGDIAAVPFFPGVRFSGGFRRAFHPAMPIPNAMKALLKAAPRLRPP
jgi:hypothetical protein